MMQQMQQQGRGAEAAKMMPKGDAPKVYLAYNRQRNSVLVNAPPDLLKIIEQTIRCLDVPYGDAADYGRSRRHRRQSAELQRYPLQNLDPDKFVSTLEEIGGLSPYASFKVDDNNKTLFALAPDSDHKKIAALLRDFDGAGRHFKVIQLRRLPADAVAATINKMMAGQNERKKKSDALLVLRLTTAIETKRRKTRSKASASTQTSKTIACSFGRPTSRWNGFKSF